MENCARGGCPERSADSCPSCVHWTPSRNSKYARCSVFLTRKLLCSLPDGSCGTCSYYLPSGVLTTGPTPLTGVDWTDPKQVYEHRKMKKLKMFAAPLECEFPGCKELPVVFHVSIYGGRTKAHLCRAHFTVLADR